MTSHGMSGTPTYASWQAMKARCQNPNDIGWRLYGGRGIKVCPEWQTFVGFLADMGERPEETSLDRIDPDGHYEPGNCRWADSITQANNTRRMHQMRANIAAYQAIWGGHREG
jgi:hypothetical protein